MPISRQILTTWHVFRSSPTLVRLSIQHQFTISSPHANIIGHESRDHAQDTTSLHIKAWIKMRPKTAALLCKRPLKRFAAMRQMDGSLNLLYRMGKVIGKERQ
ncbi:hypothetical protein SLE2022_052090 [Rubroshorea leprosula]